MNMRDTTKGAGLELEVLAAQQSLERLVAEAQDAILVLDGTETIRFANPAARQLFLVRCENLVGRPLGYPATSSEVTELDVPLRDGRVRTVEMRVSNTEWRGEAAKLIILRDITERKLAETALRKARDELEERVKERTVELVKANETLREQAALLDLAHDAILVRDLGGRILYWNKGAEKTYGWARDEALGKNVHDLLRTQSPNPPEEITEDLLDSWEWEGELRHVTRNGEFLTVASRWAVQKDLNGNPTGILEINRNIAERKSAEEQLKSYMVKLEQSNKALQDFASIASHDMQEPLRKILFFGSRLKLKWEGTLDDTGKDYLDRMQKAAKRMQTLLTALLDYSRISTKAEPFTRVDLSILVREVLDDLEVSIQQSAGEVEMGDLPTIMADPHQMRQLFQNLIGNGLKYHGKEKPIVKVYTEPSPNIAECSIAVKDNGIGFDEKYSDRIFAPFQRLHGKSEYEGTGMGLAICMKIVERHGGAITARSTQDKGSTFIIRLPMGN